MNETQGPGNDDDDDDDDDEEEEDEDDAAEEEEEEDDAEDREGRLALTVVEKLERDAPVKASRTRFVCASNTALPAKEMQCASIGRALPSAVHSGTAKLWA